MVATRARRGRKGKDRSRVPLASGIGRVAPAARLHSGRSATPPPACRRQCQTEAQRKTIFQAGKVIAGISPGNAFPGVAPVNHRLTAGAGPRLRLSRQPTRHPHNGLEWIGLWLTHPGRSAQEYRADGSQVERQRIFLMR